MDMADTRREGTIPAMTEKVKQVPCTDFTAGRNGRKILYGVFHTEADSPAVNQDAIVKYWNRPDVEASTHYLVGLRGEVVQAVDERDTAWHAANRAVNEASIGIEHEDDGKPHDPVRTDALYRSSAALVADLNRRLGIPLKMVAVDSKTKIPLEPGWVRHSQVTLRATACPAGLDCERIIREARALIDAPPETAA